MKDENLPIKVDCEIGIKLGELHKWDGTKKNYAEIMKKLGLKLVDRKWEFTNSEGAL